MQTISYRMVDDARLAARDQTPPLLRAAAKTWLGSKPNQRLEAAGQIMIPTL